MSVPDPVANADGAILHSLKARPAVVVNRLPGESETEPTAAHCSSVGEFLARLHLTGLDYPRRQANPRGLEWWNEVVPVVGRCVSDRQRLLLASELAFQNEIALSSTYRQLPWRPVHADLFRDNVLFEKDVLSGVFDFYFAGCDAFLFDVAVCLNDWCVDTRTARQDATRVAAFLGAYESVRALTPSEHVLLPAMQRAGAFRFWLSRLCDLPRQAALLKPHDPTTSSACCVWLGERSRHHEHPTTQSCSRPASTPTAAFSNRFWTPMTPSFPIPSITPPSSTVCVFARQGATGSPTVT